MTPLSQVHLFIVLTELTPTESSLFLILPNILGNCSMPQSNNAFTVGGLRPHIL